jgi:outer membrane biosynthesis protein TonB
VDQARRAARRVSEGVVTSAPAIRSVHHPALRHETARQQLSLAKIEERLKVDELRRSKRLAGVPVTVPAPTPAPTVPTPAPTVTQTPPPITVPKKAVKKTASQKAAEKVVEEPAEKPIAKKVPPPPPKEAVAERTTRSGRAVKIKYF